MASGYYGLLHYAPNEELTIESKVFFCDAGGVSDLVAGNSDSQIIDFDLSPQGDLIVLRSESTTQKDPWIGEPLRELALENLALGTRKTFHDSTLNDAVRYNQSLEAVSDPPFAKSRTLYFASHPEVFLGKLKSQTGSLYLSSVGTSGYKLTKLDSEFKAIRTISLMPNTEENSVLMDREALSFDVLDDGVALLLPMRGEDQKIYGKHFNRSLMEADAKTGQLLALILSKDLTFKEHKILSHSQYLSSGGIRLFGDSAFLLINLNGNLNHESSIYSLHTKSLALKEYRIGARGFSHSSALTVCDGKLWVGGSAGYKQVSTGSVVEAGDAFVWSLDFLNENQSVTYLGTERNDAVSGMSCYERSLFVSGVQDGPITHSGDVDKLQLRQASFFGKVR